MSSTGHRHNMIYSQKRVWEKRSLIHPRRNRFHRHPMRPLSPSGTAPTPHGFQRPRRRSKSVRRGSDDTAKRAGRRPSVHRLDDAGSRLQRYTVADGDHALDAVFRRHGNLNGVHSAVLAKVEFAVYHRIAKVSHGRVCGN